MCQNRCSLSLTCARPWHPCDSVGGVDGVWQLCNSGRDGIASRKVCCVSNALLLVFSGRSGKKTYTLQLPSCLARWSHCIRHMLFLELLVVHFGKPFFIGSWAEWCSTFLSWNFYVNSSCVSTQIIPFVYRCFIVDRKQISYRNSIFKLNLCQLYT